MKAMIITISLLLHISLFAKGKSINYASADTLLFEIRDITHIVSVDLFESIKTFILANGDREDYNNVYSNNPHYSFDGFESYLNPDIGLYNSYCDTSISDFNEIVLRDQNAIPQYYYIRIVRKGDIANEQIIIYEGTSEDKVYLYNFERNMDLMIISIDNYLEVIKKALTTSVQSVQGKNIYNLVIYPNPAFDNLLINCENMNFEVLQLEVLNLQGLVLLQREIHKANGQAQISIDVSDFQQGLYLCRFKSGENVLVIKFIKR